MTGCTFPTLTQADVAALEAMEIRKDALRKLMCSMEELPISCLLGVPRLMFLERGHKKRLYGIARIRQMSQDIAHELRRLSGWFHDCRLDRARALHLASYCRATSMARHPYAISTRRFTADGTVVALSRAARVR